MSVVIETTLGDITVDLLITERTSVCRNFLKLCKMKYYNYNLFHTVNRGFIAQTGDPTGNRSGGESVFSAIGEKEKRYFKPEQVPRIKHSRMGLISFVGDSEGMVGSQFFITLGSELYYLDESHCVFGEVVEGQDVLDIFNSDVICDSDHRPYKDVRITHTVVLDDPFPDPEGFPREVRSPSPSSDRLQGGRIAADEDVDETQGKTVRELQEMVQEREAKARATILEMVGDIPDAEMAPPENVLFVCKLNPVTTDDDLEIIFSRFGKIKGCEVIRDRRSGDSLQYAFVEFEEEKACEEAYFKMDNVLIDDRRVHVDFSQSVAKVRWMGKGKGLRGGDKSLGQGKYDRIDKNQKKARDDKEMDNDKSRSRNDDQPRKRDDKYDRKDRDSIGEIRTDAEEVLNDIGRISKGTQNTINMIKANRKKTIDMIEEKAKKVEIDITEEADTKISTKQKTNRNPMQEKIDREVERTVPPGKIIIVELRVLVDRNLGLQINQKTVKILNH